MHLELECSRTSWHFLPNDPADLISFCILLTYILKKTIPQPVFKLKHLCSNRLRCFTCPSSFLIILRRATLQRCTQCIHSIHLWIFCIFCWAIDKTPQDLKFHVNSTTALSFKHPWNPIIQKKNRPAAMETPCAKRLLEVHAIASLVPSPQVPSSPLIESMSTSY